MSPGAKIILRLQTLSTTIVRASRESSKTHTAPSRPRMETQWHSSKIGIRRRADVFFNCANASRFSRKRTEALPFFARFFGFLCTGFFDECYDHGLELIRVLDAKNVGDLAQLYTRYNLRTFCYERLTSWQKH